MTSPCDCAVIGAGHNGLIAANYLVDAGMSVAVLERRHIVGGAVCTEEIVPGYKFDVGSSAHIMFRMTPIMEELQLAQYGLEYLPMDPWAFFPAKDGGASITFYRDLDRTCESIAAISPRDADAYRDFVQRWLPLSEGVFEVFQKPPSAAAFVAAMFKRFAGRKGGAPMRMLHEILSGYGRVVEDTFENESLRTALVWLAAQSGPPPTEPGTGPFVGWHALLHKHGAWRAKGGSGALTQALAKRLESKGGHIVLDAEVNGVSRNGEEWTLGWAGGSLHAKRVLVASHVPKTLLETFDPESVPEALRKRLRHTRIGNGFGMIVRHATTALPTYQDIVPGENGVAACHSALQLLCPSRQTFDNAYGDYCAGRPPQTPAVLAMTFSAIDPSLAPPGRHVLFAWAQYHPFELRNGESWDSIAQREADKIWDVVCEYAPNMRSALVDRLIQTPAEIERRLALPRANVMHLEMGMDQMFTFRPLPEISGYKTPMPGVYLTGASTHPGGGVFGASGRSAARVILRQAGKRRG